LKAKLKEIEMPRHIYGATAAALAVYATIMFSVLDPGFKFDTWWNAGVVVNFLLGMAVSLPMAAMWPVTYILNKSPDDYLVNYIFLFISFINSWYLISAFWGGVALMIVSTVLETPEKMAEKIATGVIPADTKLKPEGALAYMIVNAALGGGAAALTFLNKKALYAWFVYSFPKQLPDDDILQALNSDEVLIKGNPLDNAKSVASDPLGTVSDKTGGVVPPKIPELPKFNSAVEDWEF